MPTCLDYAKIACAAYAVGPSQYCDEPPGYLVDDWLVQHFKVGTFGDSFQGGIWSRGQDVVVGLCGTSPGQVGKLLGDIFDDIRIFIRRLPPTQTTGARALVNIARQIAAGRRVSVCGHSLGGALAQVVGVKEGAPFVTFNAPAMKHVIDLANIPLPGSGPIRVARGPGTAGAVGINFRINGLGLDGKSARDPISTFMRRDGLDGHVGMVVDLPPASATGAHGSGTCWQAVLATDWATVDPFGG